MAKKNPAHTIETLTHPDATRKNIPTAEYQSVMDKALQDPVQVTYPRQGTGLDKERQDRNPDLDPQLIWQGKDRSEGPDLVVPAPPLYIQEKVHPKVLIDDLKHQTRARKSDTMAEQLDLFADFNGLPDEGARTEFYRHEGRWQNRMILGDSLQVMASLSEREGLRGQVQCLYFDPPYGIRFNSNFQWSTTSRDVKDGNAGHITREPEQVKAFRDTWRNGIHSFLTYLRDRLIVARDLLSSTGSIFIQISDENVHRVRLLMDEIFGETNFISSISFSTSTGRTTNFLSNVNDYVLWYARDIKMTKYRQLFVDKITDDKEFELGDLTSQGASSKPQPFQFEGHIFNPSANRHWSNEHTIGMPRLAKAGRIKRVSKTQIRAVKYSNERAVSPLNNKWLDTQFGAFAKEKVYVVQTGTKVVQRCILMTTDPGDLVIDPTCGSGTTAYVAEQWGRRWITMDTSRVALALARARIMGARYPYYLLADSRDGQLKEAEITRRAPSGHPTGENIRHGFVYERVPHITLKAIANNTEIDVIWDTFQKTLDPLRKALNQALKTKWEEWEIPREPDVAWPDDVKKIHGDWWNQRIQRQKEIDASIAAGADHEFLFDRPYEDRKKVRVAGPFTVESLSPHRVLGVDEHDELIDPLESGVAEAEDGFDAEQAFVTMILENLKTAGVQQARKEDRIMFQSLTPWPGDLICAEGRYLEGSDGDGPEKRAAIFIGPEFGTVSRPDLVQAAREAGEADFDVLIPCAFNFDAHSSEFDKLGRIQVLKARINADLHMADDLKNTGKGNLFVIFGEPDIDILEADKGQIRVKVNGVDVFHPGTGEVRSDGPEGIACWFIDTDYNEEAFFVRHAYFLGAGDPYKALKTTLKADIDADAWATLNSDTSRPFDRPGSGRIAVKVINHLGDEVMKVFRV